MKPPIIVDEHGDTSIFLSIEEAEKYLEPIDVENNEYVAYDSEGQQLDLLPTWPRVTIKDVEGRSPRTEELRNVLIRLLSYVGTQESWLETASLAELIEKAKNYSK